MFLLNSEFTNNMINNAMLKIMNQNLLVTQAETAGIPSYKMVTAARDFLKFLPTNPEKSSPMSLAEQINASIEGVGSVIYILEPDSSIKYSTNKFYLTSLQISLKERVQLLETFEAANIAFFGDSIRIYQLTGTALDYASVDQSAPGKFFHQSSLIKMYNDVLRGTLLAKEGRIGVLKIMNHLIYGYPVNLNVSYNSGLDKVAQFQMSWIVTDHKLTMPGVVDEKVLEKMYQNNSGKNNEYTDFINTYLDKSDTLMIFKKWALSGTPNDALDKIISKIGVYSFGAITYDHLQYLTSTEWDTFKEGLAKAMTSYLSYIKKFRGKKETKTDDLKAWSPLIRKWFPFSRYDDDFTEIDNNIDDINNNREKFEKIMDFLQQVAYIKNELLVLKSRMVY